MLLLRRGGTGVVRRASTLGDRSMIAKFRDPDPSKPKLVLAYSGGLDTSTQLAYLAHERGFEVCAYIADLGQSDMSEVGAIRDKAEKSGAYAFHCADLRRDFVENYVFECVKANAAYEGRYLLGTAMARPCIAKKQVEIAWAEGATHVSHGSTGKGNDQVRFELCYLGMDPSLECVTLWRDPEYLAKFEGRQDLIEYATRHGIPVSATKKHSYSEDENIMHVSYESGELEDPSFPGEKGEYPGKVLKKLTRDLVDTPDEPCRLEIDFASGKPVALRYDDFKIRGELEIFSALNDLAGQHGVGRIDIVENRYVGMKSRGCYETPGGTVLYAAHLDLETLTIDREVMRLRDALSIKFADLVYNGHWFSPEMAFLRAAMDHAQIPVTGTVSLHLHKGHVVCRGRSSPHSLYQQNLVSMDLEGGFNPQNSTGFIQTLATRLKASKRRDAALFGGPDADKIK
ncbi:hypothetical protein CTAYLR_006593 [Chrysophaeum taylorii]|uniref:argininosuccinate synthase n=1 Tax=Chrysophaeum taylorii TaxID=2483200 RepID=A0AAD7UM76_9STRA|nr:hypothetical protein CTAYLR_006593 [Chrysophaeum taylorii]